MEAPNHEPTSSDLQKRLQDVTEDNVSPIRYRRETCGYTSCHCEIEWDVTRGDAASAHLILAAAARQVWPSVHQSGLPGEQTGPTGRLQLRSFLQTSPD